jgi:hypothetical protein
VGVSTTANEASASATSEREGCRRDREREVNGMSGVGRKKIDAWMARQFFWGDAWAWAWGVGLRERPTICACVRRKTRSITDFVKCSGADYPFH